MRELRLLRNFFCYCGIEKEEYNALKKDAYISNFIVWRALHYLMSGVFFALFIGSLINELLETNRLIYLMALIYSVVALLGFYILKKDSILAQFLIYLSISVLFLFAILITANKPAIPATTFIAFLLIAPMFMIDKPYFMALELCGASAVYLTWMYQVKPYEIWQMDSINVVIFTIVGVFLNVVANSLRIREFVLTREINIQKDTDELTGLKNKGALIRGINAFVGNESTGKGLLFLFDIDRFKAINDTYGHDVGDEVIRQIGETLREHFTADEVLGRFGGDEFIIFFKNVNDSAKASQLAEDVIDVIAECVSLPDRDRAVSVSIGISVYDGSETDYTGLFKKADTALYQAKADPEKQYVIFAGEEEPETV
ncbi:MAG: GGDEF domain-containing protein [Lachnospiraceae bacterium]|nr:GGDEF domain-containing protein [Lachnospiraceae bacterium]